ncbi:DNA polymerase III subunit alpha [Candidatus Parcubacteria bacterium]|jgi:DNA polymerase-3 subunit alpha|nr:MAG: DNA polymerase III subunit alpha [Candidatus Parcubacteria bacterium]
MGFTHLHVHSHYSLLDGLPKIDELVTYAKNQGASALALTDHGVLYGAVEFFQKARAANLKPILGVEAYVARRTRFDRETKIDERPFHLVLLAQNQVGYKNLLKLVSHSHLEGFYYRPRIDQELLEKYHDGLIALSACLQGELAASILGKINATPEAVVEKYLKIFGSENYFLEVQPHLKIDDQVRVNEVIFQLAKKFNLGVVATNDVHYLSENDADIQDVLLAIQTRTTMDDPKRMTYKGVNVSMLTEAEFQKAFPKNPEVISNSLKIAERCNFELPLGNTQLPHFEVPKGETADSYLRKLALTGLPKRYPGRVKEPKILERLNYELGVIEKTGFASYFLIVQDFVNWAKNNQIVVGPGRGSAAGSIVSYLTNITNVDPLAYDLLFERFLNPERISMPDIDLDFADTRRDDVLRYVAEKYGEDHVAQIITFGTMAARAAVRDVGRVMGFPYAYCDRVAKLIPMFTALPQALATVPELKEIMQNDLDGQKLLNTAARLEGVARHASVHACGVVITKEPLMEQVPLQHAGPDDDTIITQYSLHPIEDLGLLKMDFLGLRNLTVLEQTIEIVQKAQGKNYDMDKLPLNDKKVFELLQAGHTIGIFQFESSGMRRYLKELKPTQLEDLIAMVSLYRPGPMEFIPDFIARKHGRKTANYLHPKLKPILEKTYGVAVYQEQIMEIARDLAGFTLGEADVLRKAVGKKIAKLLKEQREKFINGCVKNGIKKNTAEKVFDFIEPFARYGFNRSHAACYALIAYQTAFFKTHEPEAFMAALLTGDHGSIDRIAIEIDECRAMGIRVLPPDINESYSTFTAVYDPQTKNPTQTIRFGLTAIKNVGENVVKTIVHERKANGPYRSLEDLLGRVQVKDFNKKALESLIKSGALDRFGERGQLLGNLETLLQFNKTASQSNVSNQISLFSDLPDGHAPKLRLKPFEPATKNQCLQWEKELMGLYLSDHPLRAYQADLGLIATPLNQLAERLGDERVRVGGVVSKIQKILTKKNDSMLFVKIEDAVGGVEALIFPKLLQQTNELWREGRLVIMEGKVSDKDGEIKFLANTARELDTKALQDYANQQPNHQPLTIKLQAKIDKEKFKTLKSILEAHPGATPVEILTQNGSGEKKIKTNLKVNRQSVWPDLIRLVGNENLSFQ